MSAVYDERLSPCLGLKKDWNGYGAEAPNEVALRNAEIVLQEIDRQQAPFIKAVPSAADAVFVLFQTGDLYASIEAFNDGDIIGATQKGKANPEVWEIPLGAIPAAVSRIKEFLSPISEHVETEGGL